MGTPGREHATARVELELELHSTRDTTDPAWADREPTIQILTEQDGNLGYVGLTLHEALQVAAEIMNLVELADAQTARCSR